jgi:hypothetical protein
MDPDPDPGGLKTCGSCGSGSPTLLPGQEYFCVNGGFFPDKKWKIPGNTELPELFPARKSLISDTPKVPG